MEEIFRPLFTSVKIGEAGEGIYSFAAQGEVVGVRSGTLTGEMEGGHSGLDDLLGDECEKDGQAATCRGPGGRALRYCIIQ